MPNVAQVLKAEITRLAKREVTASLQSVKKSNAQLRKVVAALKMQVRTFNIALTSLQREARERSVVKVPVTASTQLRFVAKGLVSHRSRLGLSAAEFGRLVGVSAQSVYQWESGKTVPRAAQLQRIAQLRSLGKREVQARLARRSNK